MVLYQNILFCCNLILAFLNISLALFASCLCFKSDYNYSLIFLFVGLPCSLVYRALILKQNPALQVIKILRKKKLLKKKFDVHALYSGC